MNPSGYPTAQDYNNGSNTDRYRQMTLRLAALELACMFPDMPFPYADESVIPSYAKWKEFDGTPPDFNALVMVFRKGGKLEVKWSDNVDWSDAVAYQVVRNWF